MNTACHASISLYVQDTWKVVEMLFENPQTEKYIFYVDKSWLPVHGGQNSVHCSLKGGWCAPQSKQRPLKLVQTGLDGRGGLFVVPRVYFDFPVAGVPIQNWEDETFFQRVDGRVYQRKRIRVSDGYGVQR